MGQEGQDLYLSIEMNESGKLQQRYGLPVTRGEHEVITRIAKVLHDIHLCLVCTAPHAFRPAPSCEVEMFWADCPSPLSLQLSCPVNLECL